MQTFDLKAEKREILGRRVKKLRSEGKVPGHIFGHDFASINVSADVKEFTKVWHEAGETGIVNLKVGVETYPAMIRSVARHSVTSEPLHVDFYKVNLSEKVTVNIPLEVTGESPAVEQKMGLLLTPVTEIEVEALPTDLPESVKVDVSGLASVGDSIKISNLGIDASKVEVKTDPELVVVSIGELVTKEMEEVEAEVAAAAEAAAEAEAVEAPVEEGEAAPGEAAEGEEQAAEQPQAEGQEPPSEQG